MKNSNITVPASTNNYAISSTGTVTIDGGELRSDDYAGLKSTGSSSSISSKNAEIVADNDDYVINAQTSTDVNLYPQGDGGNTLKGLGLNAEGGSSIAAGNDIAGVGEQHFCRQTGTVKLRASGSGSEIYGEFSYYTSGNDPTEVAISGGTIFYSGNEGSSTCSYPKRGGDTSLIVKAGGALSLPQLIRRVVQSNDTDGILNLLDDAEVPTLSSESAAVMSELRNAFKVIKGSAFRSSLKTLAPKFATVSYPNDLLTAQFKLIKGSALEAANGFVELAGNYKGSEIGNQALTELAILSMRNGNYMDATYFNDQITILSNSDLENKLSIGSMILKGQRSSSSTNLSKSSPLRQQYELAGTKTSDVIRDLSAYPNPFNPQTAIQFRLKYEGDVSVHVVDLLGRVVETLINQRLQAGYHRVTFSADDRASGIYFVRVTTQKKVISLPIVFMK